MKEYSTHYGNLQSYALSTMPAARSAYGSGHNISKHQSNVRDLLRILFLGGPHTTWEAAKVALGTNDTAKIRVREMEYRRLFVGRYDSAKYSAGMLDMGLVIRDKAKTYGTYRLSLHGILYYVDATNPSDKDIDAMAYHHADWLPRVFGRWNGLKRVLGSSAYLPLRILARGILLDGRQAAIMEDGSIPPLRELMSFLLEKYGMHYKSIPEARLAEQASCWYYTSLLYPVDGGRKRLQDALGTDDEIHKWYCGFLSEARTHYKSRLDAVRRFDADEV